MHRAIQKKTPPTQSHTCHVTVQIFVADSHSNSLGHSKGGFKIPNTNTNTKYNITHDSLPSSTDHSLLDVGFWTKRTTPSWTHVAMRMPSLDQMR